MKTGQGIATVGLMLSAELLPSAQYAGPLAGQTAQPLGDAATAMSDDNLSLAVCPVVYQLDEASSERGYHYVFYGNAFFINREGYLITAAHVLSDFHDGGQPYLLLRLPDAPPRLVKAEVIAVDSVHDVAVLRAATNPFAGRYRVAYLALTVQASPVGTTVVAGALRPSRLKDPHTFDAPREDYSSAEIMQYTSSALGTGQVVTELFLFDHEVIRGQSGAPVVEQNGNGVVGIVEGRWLRPISRSGAGRQKRAMELWEPQSRLPTLCRYCKRTRFPGNNRLHRLDPDRRCSSPHSLTVDYEEGRRWPQCLQ